MAAEFSSVYYLVVWYASTESAEAFDLRRIQ